MNAKLERYVNDGFMTEAQANYIEEAIKNGETLIASGHVSANVRNLMAATMSIAMEQHKTTKVAGVDDVQGDALYFVVPKLNEDTYQDVLQAVLNKKGAALVTMKIPEHPYSVIKMMKDAYKAELDENKVINLMECNKIDNVPKLMKFSRMSYGENGKVLREDKEVLEV